MNRRNFLASSVVATPGTSLPAAGGHTLLAEYAFAVLSAESPKTDPATAAPTTQ